MEDITIEISSEKDYTLPIQSEYILHYEDKPKLLSNQIVGKYELLELMSVTHHSEVWFSRIDTIPIVLKISDRPFNVEMLEQIRLIDDNHLAEIIDYGEENGMYYEVYPYYKNGTIQGPIDEETIRKTILPGLIIGVGKLHTEGLIHNDLKPENIFWNNDYDGIIIGDFGSVRPNRTKPSYITPAYAAPEVLLRDVSGRYSDWFSIGLLLGKLIDNENVITASTIEQALYSWDRGVYYKKGSFQFQQLINGLIQVDPRKRLGPKAAQHFCNGEGFGSEERAVSDSVKNRYKPTLEFDNPKMIATDVDSLLDAIQNHWDYSIFLMKQGKIENFLSQINYDSYAKCKEYRRLPNMEDALFRLVVDLCTERAFIWRGVRYASLKEIEKSFNISHKLRDDIIAFLQRGLAYYYLENHGATSEQLKLVKRLQNMGADKPVEACKLFFQAVRGNEGIEWEQAVFKSIDDVINWLEYHVDALDEEIDKMLNNSEFVSWLEFLGFGNIIIEIRRKCFNEQL